MRPSYNISICQAATGVSSSYDALLELFECLTSFLKRLEIYTNLPPTPVMTDVIIKIMAELLSVLALATKQINQGRFSKYKSHIHTVLPGSISCREVRKEIIGGE